MITFLPKYYKVKIKKGEFNMLGDFIYLLGFTGFFMFGLGLMSFAVEKIPFLDELFTKALEHISFCEEENYSEEWNGEDDE